MERVVHEDPEIEEAVNAAPPMRTSARDLAKPGWVKSGSDASTRVIVGHRPMARVAAPRHPKVRAKDHLDLQGLRME